ncbi:iron-sulfur cluster assembly scaffold protein [Patescibacteria group bacterium]|nr:iron-sulfur cluster assembly scaffold protein [Patescibacteria group bacterium]
MPCGSNQYFDKKNNQSGDLTNPKNSQADNDKWFYSEEVKEHFFSPKNLLSPEDEKHYQASGYGIVGSPACGDLMKVWIKVDPIEDKITEFKWRTFGCASAISSTSILSVMVTKNGGMELDEAMKITPQDIVDKLGGLPNHKIHCSVLGDQALRAAVNDYYKKTNQESRIKEEAAKVVCSCLNITDKEIEKAVLEGKTTYEEVQRITKCGTDCGNCKPQITNLIDMYIKKYYGDEN